MRDIPLCPARPLRPGSLELAQPKGVFFKDAAGADLSEVVCLGQEMTVCGTPRWCGREP